MTDCFSTTCGRIRWHVRCCSCSTQVFTAENWDGDVYKGSRWNILNLLIILFVAVPLFGLLFAYQARLLLLGTPPIKLQEQ